MECLDYFLEYLCAVNKFKVMYQFGSVSLQIEYSLITILVFKIIYL